MYTWYYIHSFKFKEEIAGVSRERFINAVKAELPSFEMRENEGVKLSFGYVRPIYLQPLFQQQIAYGEAGCPFKCPRYNGHLNYDKGTCPVCEKMHFEELVINEFMLPSMSKDDIDDVINAFNKVWKNINDIKNE